MQVSLSAVQLMRSCEWAYYARYVLGLEKREAAPPLELGKLLHEYLGEYYNGLRRNVGPEEAHDLSLLNIHKEWHPRLVALASTAYEDGAEETAITLSSMLEQATILAERYHVVHGRDDAEKYEVVLIEQPLRVRLGDDIESYGIADLVLRERTSGMLYMVEHKTTRSIPSAGYRLMDLQTTLYIEKLRVTHGLDVRGVLWNYLRTKAPEVPEQTKGGKFSRARIDTTWAAYKDAVEAAGQDPADYDDMRVKLEAREAEAWFPRYDYLLLADAGLLLRDYVQSAQDIQERRRQWESGERVPIRSISRSCDYCFANKICEAAITLGGYDEIVKQYYTTREQRRAKESAL